MDRWISPHRHRPVITPSTFAISPVVVFSFFWSGSTTTSGFLVGLVAIQAFFRRVRWLFSGLIWVDWCWFIVRGKYCWLVGTLSPEQWPVRPSGSQRKLGRKRKAVVAAIPSAHGA